MKSGQRLKFFQRQENRLLVTLTLSVLYPICCAAIFAAFVFVILPGTPMIVNSSIPWLYVYWLAAAGIWLLSLAVFLPLMRDDELDKIMNSVQRESGINLKRVTLMGSDDPLKEEDKRPQRKSNKDSTSDESEEGSDLVIKKEKESLMESEFKSSPFQQRPFPSAGSPPRERIMNSSEFLNDTEFSFDDSIVKVHAVDDRTYQERTLSTDDLSKTRLLNPKKIVNDKNRKTLSNQNLRAISREEIKNMSLDNISRVRQDRINVDDESVKTICEKLAMEIQQSKLSGRKFKIDIVKSETVYEYSLPTPEPLSPNSMQNTVFLYVNRD